MSREKTSKEQEEEQVERAIKAFEKLGEQFSQFKQVMAKEVRDQIWRYIEGYDRDECPDCGKPFLWKRVDANNLNAKGYITKHRRECCKCWIPPDFDEREPSWVRD